MLASLAQLDRSHRRHDEVMTALVAAARRLAAGRPEAGDLDAVHGAVAYFERAVTRHFLDEEGSVFPRLSTRRPELAARLAALSAEHPSQIQLHHELAALAHQLDGDARPASGKQLLDLAEQLEAQHRAHVATEDEIFGSAGDALTEEDDREIVSEMEMRRDRDGGGGGSGRGSGSGTGRGGGSGSGTGRGGGSGSGRGGGSGSGRGGGSGTGSRRKAARPAARAAKTKPVKAAAKTAKAPRKKLAIAPRGKAKRRARAKKR